MSLLVVAASGGCIDFVAPDLPELGAPAVLETRLVLEDGVGLVVNARLAPGLGEHGFRRSVRREALRVLGIAIDPDTVLANGTREYRRSITLGAFPDTLFFEAPEVGDLTASPPAVRWSAVRREGRDTLELLPGEDLVVRLDTTTRAAQPRPELRQWVLTLSGDSASFSISASGPPPDSIAVPARWIPPAKDGIVTAMLIDQKSARVQPPPGDYIGLVTLDNRIVWTVRVHPGNHARN